MLEHMFFKLKSSTFLITYKEIIILYQDELDKEDAIYYYKELFKK